MTLSLLASEWKNYTGEASTTRIAQNKNACGFDENKIASKEGGNVAGIARKELEKKSCQKVSTKENFLNEAKKTKRKKLRQ